MNKEATELKPQWIIDREKSKTCPFCIEARRRVSVLGLTPSKITDHDEALDFCAAQSIEVHKHFLGHPKGSVRVFKTERIPSPSKGIVQFAGTIFID